MLEGEPKILLQDLADPIIDKVSDSLIYIGYAPIGVLETDAGWSIKKVIVVGSVTKFEYAVDPDTSKPTNLYKFKWSDRATLTYSR